MTEGKWRYHVQTCRELPERSIVFHCDQDDVFAVHHALHDRFTVSRGIPNVLLSFGQLEKVRAFVRRVIDELAPNGG